MRQTDEFVVEHAYTVLADRAHAQLWLEGDTELAHHDHVEGRVERSGDFERDRHASSGKADHNRMLGTQVPQASSQLLAGVTAISKQSHHNLLRRLSVTKEQRDGSVDAELSGFDDRDVAASVEHLVDELVDGVVDHARPRGVAGWFERLVDLSRRVDEIVFHHQNPGPAGSRRRSTPL